MNYSEPLYQQVFVFLKAIAGGIIIGLFYDLMETLQKIISDRRSAVITKDLMFCFFASVFSFFFMVLYNNGRARFILFLAQALGAFVFHICFGKYISKALEKIGLCFKKLFIIMLSPFFEICKRVVELLKKQFLKIKNYVADKKTSLLKKTKKEIIAKKTKKCRKRTKKEKNSEIQ